MEKRKVTKKQHLPYETPKITDRQPGRFVIWWSKDPSEKLQGIRGVLRVSQMSSYQYLVYVDEKFYVTTAPQIIKLLKGAK